MSANRFNRRIECECGNPKRACESACARCRALDGLSGGGMISFAIVQTIRASDGPMTVREIANDLDCSRNNVEHAVLRLYKRGVLRRVLADSPYGGRPPYLYSLSGVGNQLRAFGS